MERRIHRCIDRGHFLESGGSNEKQPYNRQCCRLAAIISPRSQMAVANGFAFVLATAEGHADKDRDAETNITSNGCPKDRSVTQNLDSYPTTTSPSSPASSSATVPPPPPRSQEPKGPKHVHTSASCSHYCRVDPHSPKVLYAQSQSQARQPERQHHDLLLLDSLAPREIRRKVL